MYTQVIIGWFKDRSLILSEIISVQNASAYIDFWEKKNISVSWHSKTQAQ